MPGSSEIGPAPYNGSTATVPAKAKWSPFLTTTHTYKTVQGHPIHVDILIPKHLLDSATSDVEGTKELPVIVRIHGGFLIGGERSNANWCPRYALELALRNNAIVVMPDYRLLPESNGHDILEDMDDFWAWMGNHDGFQYAVSTATEERFEPDLTRLLVVGESAGGYLAIQLALSHFNDTRLHIRALIAIYPMLGLRAPHWTKPYRKEIFDAPQCPTSMIDDHLERIKREIEQGRKPVKSCEPMEGLPRGALAIATVQHGRFLELLDPEHASNPEGTNGRKLHPEERIFDDAILQLPTSLFLHGTDDRAVPIAGTDNFVNLLREKGYDEGRLLYRRPPGDHGFENDFSLYDEDADRAWLKDGIEFVEREWNSQAE